MNILRRKIMILFILQLPAYYCKQVGLYFMIVLGDKNGTTPTPEYQLSL